MEKSQHFYRAMELNLTIGSENLRLLTKKLLEDKSVTLRQHLNEPQVKRALSNLSLFPDQKQTLNDPDPQLSAMDVSLLTILLLKTFPGQITAADQRSIEGLRDKRNSLAHRVKAELEDDTLFKETSHLILAISKSIDARHSKNTVKLVNELQRRELVNTYSTLDRILVNNEMYMIKLVQSSTPGIGEKKDHELLIKYGLTKWIRQLCRGIEAAEFINRLKGQNIISEKEKRSIEQEYSNEGQMRQLVLHMCNFASKKILYKFCDCLRQESSQLADLVENESDGQEIEQYLIERAKRDIRKALHEALEMSPNNYVATEEIHIYVEEKIGDLFDFSLIRECLLNQFPDVQNLPSDCSFNGVTWKTEVLTENPVIDTEKRFNLHELSCEEFADYMGNHFSKRRAIFNDMFRTAILDESISAPTFLEMTQDQLERTFSLYMGSIKYGEGIKMDMQMLQNKIRKSITEVNFSVDSVTETLRMFDYPVETKSYTVGVVKAPNGNLLVPHHAFVDLCSHRKHVIHFITKETVRFTAACMNGRQNGTIHFGIKPLQNGFGEIVGIADSYFSGVDINEKIMKEIVSCFGENISAAKRCIRPVQIVPVESGNCVIEIDVVPYSFHLSSQMIPISFPPKGCKSQKFFMFDSNEIVTVSRNKLDIVRDVFDRILNLRERQEDFASHNEKKGYSNQNKLRKLLTRGNKYVQDELIPVIISGRISDSDSEIEIREMLDIDRTFSSAELVLDFDSSTKLRDKVEGSKSKFSKYLVKTAENLTDLAETEKQQKSDSQVQLPTWLYCNGNDEIQSPPYPLKEWTRERSIGVKAALSKIRKKIPKNRGILIFLVYDTQKVYQDPLFETARDALLFTFRDECLVISNKDKHVTYLKNEVSRSLDDASLESSFISGIRWDEISRIMNSVFRVNEDVICSLPCSKGHSVEMTAREKGELNLHDIEILSGEQCSHEEETMNDDDRKSKRHESQDLFYKGGLVSWWNFYYRNQVGIRDQFEKHRNEIKEIMSNDKGDDIVEIHEIEHQPGAGGSTLGRHLLWEFSQFRGDPNSAFRCCVVNNISDDTVSQIDRFRSFKDADDTRPFIVLTDNESEENIMLLKTNLYELAYKTATPGKLFCLLILINRMSISHKKARGKQLLKHELSPREKNWFEDKFEEMESKSDHDVRTLIAFNCMRNSFNETYIMETVERIMQGIASSEIDALKCLALISSYESDSPIPQNIFDKMMNKEFDNELITRQPFGIAHHVKELERLAKYKAQTWNVKITEAMQLLLTKRKHESFYHSGVCIVSKLLAKAVLCHIMKTRNTSLEEVVLFVLQLLKEHIAEPNPMSKQFVKIVCSLFKTRQLIDSEKGEGKLKFSDLVLELEHQREMEDDETARQRVIHVMQTCFDITDDAMVGQQLARFNIHIKQFEEAETAIKRSISKIPQSSYLLDTHGQIFKSKMEYLLETSVRIKDKITDDAASVIIVNALTAMEKFKDGQALAIKHDEDTNWICFRMEILTALNLLEKFSKFSCYCDRENFLGFLNDEQFELSGSSFENIMVLCPFLENIRAGREAQRHVDTSIRCLQERFYQVKRQLYPIHTERDILLLKLRERFERFYGTISNTSQYKYLYGIGLKPLQQAKESNPDILEMRVKEAEENLTHKRLSEVDERDLLVYLGTKIITISNQRDGAQECTTFEYKQLLKYSNRLVDIQNLKKSAVRPYLESFLYFAMLHWPSRNRLNMDLDELASPTTYLEKLEQWERAYNENFFLKTPEQIRKNRPKNYFALAKGSIGNDIIDLESIRRQWKELKKENGRNRRPVFRDFFWKEGFVVERLDRLAGIVDGNGHHILHKVEYSQHGTRTFKINTYYPCNPLSNRKVTFVLGFTWKGPTALDVDEKDNSGQCYGPLTSILDFDDQPSSIEMATENVDEKESELVGDENKGACGGPEDDKYISKENARDEDRDDVKESKKGISGHKADSKANTKPPPWKKPHRKRKSRRK